MAREGWKNSRSCPSQDTSAISAVGGLQLLCVQHLFFGSENNVFNAARVCEKLFFVIEHKEIWIISLYLQNIVYILFRQLWLVLGVKLMEINSNLFSRYFSHATTYTTGHSM